MAVQAIRVGQRWEGTSWCEGMRLEVLDVPKPPRPLEIRFEPGHGGARVIPADGSEPFWGTQGMTRTWLRRYYRLLP